MTVDQAIHRLKEGLIPFANPVKASEMKQYMKNNFDFLGIQATQRRKVQKEWIKNVNQNLSVDLRFELIQFLWNLPEREFQLVAIDWVGTWNKSTWRPEIIEIFEWMLKNKSWWDSVDLIASHYVGAFLQMFPIAGSVFIDHCRESNNLWLNRTAILFQLKYKKDTNVTLLIAICHQFESNKAFFIQKAIGWALREFAKSYPNQIHDIVADLQLIGLAKREALKHF